MKDGKKTIIPFSDHRGMIATLAIHPIIEYEPDRITLNLDESKIDQFKDKIKDNMKIWNEMYEKNKNNAECVDLLAEYFQLLIVDGAKEIFGFKRFNSRSVNWIDKEVQKILKEKNKIKNKISHVKAKMKKHFGSIKNAARSMKIKLKKIKHKYNRINKKLYKHKHKNILKSTHKFEKLINDPNVDKEKLFYEAIDKISNRKSKNIPPLRNIKNDEIIATSDMEIAKTSLDLIFS